MEIISDVSEDEFVAIFLRGEINSSRYGATVNQFVEAFHATRNLIDSPEIENANENCVRKAILRAFRGYGANALLFSGFPLDVHWKRVMLNGTDIVTARYANYPYWIGLSNGSRRPSDAAAKIIEGRIADDPEDIVSHLRGVAASLRDGARFPESILVAPNDSSELVIMEGHARFTAFALEPSSVLDQVEAIVGFSPNIRQWAFF